MNCPKCGYRLNPGAVLAKHRKNSQTPERRREIALNAIKARWAKRDALKSAGNGSFSNLLMTREYKTGLVHIIRVR